METEKEKQQIVCHMRPDCVDLEHIIPSTNIIITANAFFPLPTHTLSSLSLSSLIVLLFLYRSLLASCRFYSASFQLPFPDNVLLGRLLEIRQAWI